MRIDKNLYGFLLCLHLFILAYSEKNESVFVATNEWQRIKPGTTLPKELNIRYNIETGFIEGKLKDKEKKKDKDLNDDTTSRSTIILHPDEEIESKEDDTWIKEHLDDLEFSTEDVKNVLKERKNEKIDNMSSDKKDPNAETNVRKETKSTKKVPYRLGINDMVFESDKLLFNALFKKFLIFKTAMSKTQLLDKEIAIILETLNALEYIMHHIDNSRLFTNMGGLTKIIFPCLNSTYDNIKLEALKLLGAATQLNPEVQTKALETGLIRKILRLLWSSSKSLVKTRCLYALSALIRNFPEAQKSFFDFGGIELFGKILNEEDDDFDLKLRVIRLVNDLVVEREDIEYATELEENKVEEYAATDFKNRLLTHGYCDNLMNLMVRVFKQELDDPTKIENYELLEVIIESMTRISTVCKQEFQRNQHEIIDIVNDLIDFYEEFSHFVDSNTISLLNQQIVLIERFMIVIDIPRHDEL